MVHLDVSLGEILLLVFAWHFFTPIFTWFGVVLYKKVRRKFFPSTFQSALPWERYITFVDLTHSDSVDGMLVEAHGFDTPEAADEFKERVRQSIINL